MERMAEAVPDCNDQSLQHILTNSPWDDQLVVGQLSHDANTLLGGCGNSCLNLDESGMPKKGDKSVGVSRQWCGQLGKTDNCQVIVYSTLCHGEHAVPIGFRLFFPKPGSMIHNDADRQGYRMNISNFIASTTWRCNW